MKRWRADCRAQHFGFIDAEVGTCLAAAAERDGFKDEQVERARKELGLVRHVVS